MGSLPHGERHTASEVMKMPTLKWRLLTGIAVLATIAVGTVWFLRREGQADLSRGSIPATLAVDGASFLDGGEMPQRLTCDGDNLSPDIKIPPVPPATKNLVVVMDDLDAPFGFIHWLVYDIPPSVREIAEGASSRAQLPPHAAEGTNDFGRMHYDGPCPPSGRHRYRLGLYAIDVSLGVPAGETQAKLAAAVSGHILARGQIIGIYSH